MAKKVTGQIKLQITAGRANPSPPIGPALGAAGVNIPLFCKEFNARTQAQAADGLIIPTIITVFQDKSFTFETKTPPASYMIKKATKLKSGSGEPGKVVAGQIKQSQVKEIAEAKMKDLNANDIDQAMKIIEGSCRSMGLDVVEG